MADETRRWRRIHEDGTEWEARVTAGPQQSDPDEEGSDELLEFVCVDGSRRARRLVVSPGSIEDMDDVALRRAYRRALPIGGDYYGRPGKRMDDAQ